MRGAGFLAGIAWLICGGLVAALLWHILASVLRAMRSQSALHRFAAGMAGYCYWPVGKVLLDGGTIEGKGDWIDGKKHLLKGWGARLVWFLACGWLLSATHFTVAVVCCASVVAWEQGRQSFKMSFASLLAADLRSLSRRRADEILRINFVERMARYHRMSGGEQSAESTPADQGDLPDDLPRLATDVGWFLEVEGESEHQEEIQGVYQATSEDGGLRVTWLTLVPHLEHSSDASRVSVVSDGKTLGYLPRSLGQHYVARIGASAALVSASLYRHDEEVDERYGVWLSMKWPPRLE